MKIISIRADGSLDMPTTIEDYLKIFFRGIITNVSNPKALVFFLSFLPQFVPTNSSNIVLMIFLLGSMLCAIGSTLNFLFGITGVSLKYVAKKRFLNRTIEQYVTALIFITVSFLFLSEFVQDKFL